jgi:hypothetical protein
MSILFLGISSIGTFYFLLKNRYFDFFTVAFFSSIVYFMPGFFGYVGLYSNLHWDYSEILPETYFIMISVMASIVLFAFISDLIQKDSSKIIKIKHDLYVGSIALVLSIASFLMEYMTVGNSMFANDKADILESLSRWTILFEYFLVLAILIFYDKQKYFILLFAFYFVYIDLVFMHFRSVLVWTIIGILISSLNHKGKIRLYKYWKQSIILFGFFIFALAFKMLSGGMIVDFDSLIQVIKSEDFLLLLFMTSEPFTIQEILNEVVKNDFESSPFQFSGLLGLLVPFLPEIGFNVISFNDLFQPYLFSNVDYGMANNIWAQMWSAGGYFLFFIFIIIYNYILYIGSKYIRYTEGSLKIFIIFLMVIWSFYIHRNDIVGQLTLEKRAFIIYLVALVSSWIIFVVIQKIKNVLFMRKFQ